MPRESADIVFAVFAPRVGVHAEESMEARSVEVMVRVKTDRSNNWQIIRARSKLKYWSTRLRPPSKKLSPEARSKFESMVPMIESFRTSIWSDLRRRIDRIN